MEKKYPLLNQITTPLQKFLKLEASGGIILLFCTVAAIIWANSSYSQSYLDLWQSTFAFRGGIWGTSKPLIFWINDGLMALFFFVVGLEIKREILAGELSTFRQAFFPIGAALGGMAAPALIYTAFHYGSPTANGWAIPTATDIAFSLGILALLGSRVPLGLKIFLTAFAIVDDIGAVLIIALFYSSDLGWNYLFISGGILGILIALNISQVRHLILYLICGILLWFLFLKAGIHPTVAGVILAFTIPSRPALGEKEFQEELRHLAPTLESISTESPALTKDQIHAVQKLEASLQKMVSPLQKLETSLHSWVIFFIMPIFALSNAGVPLQEGLLQSLSHPLSFSIALSMVLGKTAGIFLFCWISVKMKWADLPRGTAWKDLAGVACLGGVGFTMSLFISNLAFPTGQNLDISRLGILTGSLVAGVLGYLWLYFVLPLKRDTSEEVEE